MSIQSKYFLIAVIFFGSAGIWLPVGIEAIVDKTVTFHSIPPNITTYFVSILFAGCIDYFLSKFRDLTINGIINLFFDIIFIVIIGVVLVVGSVLFNVYHWDLASLILGIFGVFIAYRIWWIANINNPNFTPTAAPLGGDANKPLANG